MDSPASSETGSDGSRPIDAVLAAYAAGVLDPYTHALIAAHLMLSAENRAFVRTLEAAAAASLERADAPPPSRAARDHILSAIYAGGHYGQPRPVARDPDVPEPLARLIGRPLAEVPWRRKTPGLREHRLFDRDGLEASLFRIKARHGVPTHTHEGAEITLVLKGAFSDSTGRYGRGDVAVADPSIDHRPTAEDGEDCVCFAVIDAPLRLTGPIGRVIERFFRA